MTIAVDLGRKATKPTNQTYLTACYLYQVMMTLHILNDVANDAESTQKSKITS